MGGDGTINNWMQRKNEEERAKLRFGSGTHNNKLLEQKGKKEEILTKIKDNKKSTK
jgi:hypothetical protein